MNLTDQRAIQVYSKLKGTAFARGDHDPNFEENIRIIQAALDAPFLQAIAEPPKQLNYDPMDKAILDRAVSGGKGVERQCCYNVVRNIPRSKGMDEYAGGFRDGLKAAEDAIERRGNVKTT